jgi:transposase
MELTKTNIKGDPMSSLAEMIGLSGWKLLHLQRHGESWCITAEPEGHRPCCPHCGAAAGRQYRHGWRRRYVAHIPVGLECCDLLVRFARYRCQECRRTHTPELPGVARRARLSDGLRRYVNALAAKFQLGVRTLMEWLRLGWNTIWRCIRAAPPPDLGRLCDLCLDEVFFREPRQYLTVLSCADGRVLDLEPGRGEQPSRRLLERLPAEAREQIETLATDFSPGQRRAAYTCLPQAEVVADCFHLLRLARRAVRDAAAAERETVRRAVRQLRRLLREKDHAALGAWLGRWQDTAGTLHTLWKTVDQWQLEIEGYLTTGRSTGPAEALNRRIALLRRRACGYTNLHNFTRRIMLLNLSLHH